MADVNTNNNQNDIISNLRKISMDLSSSLKDAARALEKAVRESEDTDKHNKDITKQFQDSLDDLSGDFTAGLNRDISNRNMNTRSLTNSTSLLGVVFNTSTKAVGTYINSYVKAGDKLLDGFNNNIEKVTMMTGRSNQEYYQLINTFSNEITGYSSSLLNSSANLERAFNQLDYLQEYTELLESGFSDSTASTLTMSNLIAKKVLPGLNTNSREYMNLSRRLPGLSESISSLQHYFSEQSNQETRLTSQDYDVILRSFQDQILASAIDRETGKGDRELATKNFTNIMESYDAIIEKGGRDSAESFIQILTNVLNKGIDASNVGFLMGTGVYDAESLYEAMGTEEGFAKLYDEYTKYLSDMYMKFGPDAGPMVAEAMQVSYNDMIKAVNAVAYGGGFNAETLAENIKKDYEASAEYQEAIKEIADGTGTTIDEQYENQKMNNEYVRSSAIFLSNISETQLQIADILRGGLGQILNALISGNLFGNLLSGSGGSGALSTLGNVARVGAGVAGVGIGVAQGIAEYQDSGDIGKSIAEGFLGDIESENFVDGLGDAVTNGIKWASIGTAIAPGVGTAIGAVVGVGSNLSVKIIKWVTDFVTRTDPMTAALESLSTSFTDLEETTGKYNGSLEKLSELEKEKYLTELRVQSEKVESSYKAIMSADYSNFMDEAKKVRDYANLLEESKDVDLATQQDMMFEYLLQFKNTMNKEEYNKWASQIVEAEKPISSSDMKGWADAVSKSAYGEDWSGFETYDDVGVKGALAQLNAAEATLESESTIIKNLAEKKDLSEEERNVLTNSIITYMDAYERRYGFTLTGGTEDVFRLIGVNKENAYLPQHALGLTEVPYDNYIASLHQGEMVLTADIAEGIRTMVENNNIQALPVVTSSDLSTQTNLVVNAIQAQTNELVGAIQKIYEVLSTRNSTESIKDEDEDDLGISSTTISRGTLWR